jgi:hypothetical protein
MPKGPNGQKRPADAIGAAIMVAKIATGELQDDVDNKTELHRASGKKGGNERAKSLSAKQRQDIAKIAAEARWKKSV